MPSDLRVPMLGQIQRMPFANIRQRRSCAKNGPAERAKRSPRLLIILTAFLGCAVDTNGQELRGGLKLFVEAGVNHSARTLAFSPDGKFIAGNGVDRTIRVWDLSLHREIVAIPHERDVSAFAFHPKRRLLVSLDLWGESITLWDMESKSQIYTRTCTDRPVKAPSKLLGFTADGAAIICFDPSASALRRWEMGTGRELPAISLPSLRNLRDVTLSLDGNHIAGRDEANVVHVLKVSDGADLTPSVQLPMESWALDSFSFITSGNKLMIARVDFGKSQIRILSSLNLAGKGGVSIHLGFPNLTPQPLALIAECSPMRVRLAILFC